MNHFPNSSVSTVFAPSCIPYTLQFSVQNFLAFAKKSLFLGVPLILLLNVLTQKLKR